MTEEDTGGLSAAVTKAYDVLLCLAIASSRALGRIRGQRGIFPIR